MCGGVAALSSVSFLKLRRAYALRISDGISDVCSSDPTAVDRGQPTADREARHTRLRRGGRTSDRDRAAAEDRAEIGRRGGGERHAGGVGGHRFGGVAQIGGAAGRARVLSYG